MNKNDFYRALDFVTKGIDVKCNDDQLNATLYTNRATAHFNLGKPVLCMHVFKPIGVVFSEWPPKNFEKQTKKIDIFINQMYMCALNAKDDSTQICLPNGGLEKLYKYIY